MNQRTRTGSRHQAGTADAGADRTPAPPSGGCVALALGAPTLSDIMGTMFVALTAPEVHGSAGAGRLASRRSR